MNVCESHANKSAKCKRFSSLITNLSSFFSQADSSVCRSYLSFRDQILGNLRAFCCPTTALGAFLTSRPFARGDLPSLACDHYNRFFPDGIYLYHAACRTRRRYLPFISGERQESNLKNTTDCHLFKMAACGSISREPFRPGGRKLPSFYRKFPGYFSHRKNRYHEDINLQNPTQKIFRKQNISHRDSNPQKSIPRGERAWEQNLVTIPFSATLGTPVHLLQERRVTAGWPVVWFAGGIVKNG